ncbi:hypothetical protein B566_EDAN004950 [Ephemera danica]|nr:hypothetical protein B566_EDAN004950 [Ephemera danica]
MRQHTNKLKHAFQLRCERCKEKHGDLQMCGVRYDTEPKCWSNYEVSHLTCPEINVTNIQDLGIGSVKHCHCKNNCMPVALTCEKYGAAKRWVYNSSVCSRTTTHGRNVKVQGFDEHLLVTYTLNTFSFTCEPGYKIHGTNESTCMDGRLNTQPPKCEPVSDNCTTKSSRRIANLMLAFGSFMIFLALVILFCRYCNRHAHQHGTTLLRVPVATSSHKNTKYSKLG